MLLGALFVIAYLVGSVPIGHLVGRAHGVDLREVGSGSIGATNVRRALGWGWAITVFLLDLGKGFLPAFCARFVAPGQEGLWYVVGAAAVLGHCFSPWLGFRGGKGIATSLGMVFGASPWVAAGGFAVFVVCLLLSRFVSLSSIIAVFCSILVGLLLHDWIYVGVGIAIFVFVLYTHRRNLQRLRAGDEPKIAFAGSPSGESRETSP